jgi:hypothetical protein
VAQPQGYSLVCLVWGAGTAGRSQFVSLMSSSGVPVEEIARLAGHSSSRTTEVVCRRELRPVLTTGAEVMDKIFKSHPSEYAEPGIGVR